MIQYHNCVPRRSPNQSLVPQAICLSTATAQLLSLICTAHPVGFVPLRPNATRNPEAARKLVKACPVLLHYCTARCATPQTKTMTICTSILTSILLTPLLHLSTLLRLPGLSAWIFACLLGRYEHGSTHSVIPAFCLPIMGLHPASYNTTPAPLLLQTFLSFLKLFSAFPSKSITGLLAQWQGV